MTPPHAAKTKTPKDEWQTPSWLFDELNKEFHFEIDAAATLGNSLCDRCCTKECSAFDPENTWDKNTFCNPPYGKSGGGLLKWIERGFQQSQAHDVAVVFVIPGDTSTAYFRFCLEYASEIRVLNQRIRFLGATGSPPWPTHIVVFRPVKRRIQGCAHVSVWHYRSER